MREVQANLDSLRTSEEQLLRDRLRTADQARQVGTVGSIATSLLALGLLTYLYRLWWRHARQTAANAEELRRANLHLQESAQLLEQRVQERTSELSEANAELEAFSRTVAHDLRAPVRNIQAYAAAVLEDQGERLTREGALFMERLVATSQRMEDLITGLLEYSRLARAHLPLERVELQALVEQSLVQLRPDIESTHARVQTDTPLPAVLAHRGTLLQVVENIMANALKFVRPGEAPELRIRAERRQQDVVLAFEDRGIGIAAPDQERVFDAFERLHGQESYPGTGIGLAIVRRGIERMGGRVAMQSAPGAGSRFELHLKAA
jgi:light-regulated signal transduction histidine kinase (bacteriophytochrome)